MKSSRALLIDLFSDSYADRPSSTIENVSRIYRATDGILFLNYAKAQIFILKVAATDMRYFTTSKYSMSLVHKKHFSFAWQVVFKLGYLFC